MDDMINLDSINTENKSVNDTFADLHPSFYSNLFDRKKEKNFHIENIFNDFENYDNLLGEADYNKEEKTNIQHPKSKTLVNESKPKEKRQSVLNKSISSQLKEELNKSRTKRKVNTAIDTEDEEKLRHLINNDDNNTLTNDINNLAFNANSNNKATAMQDEYSKFDESSFNFDYEMKNNSPKNFKIKIKKIYEMSIVKSKQNMNSEAFAKEIMIVGNYEIQKLTNNKEEIKEEESKQNDNSQISKSESDNENPVIKRKKGTLFLNLSKINLYDFAHYSSENYITHKIEKILIGKYGEGTNKVKREELLEIRNSILSSNPKVKFELSFIKLINILDVLFNTTPKLLKDIESNLKEINIDSFFIFLFFQTLMNEENLMKYLCVSNSTSKFTISKDKISSLFDTVFNSIKVSLKKDIKNGLDSIQELHEININKQNKIFNQEIFSNQDMQKCNIEILENLFKHQKENIQIISEKATYYVKTILEKSKPSFFKLNLIINQFDLLSLAEIRRNLQNPELFKESNEESNQHIDIKKLKDKEMKKKTEKKPKFMNKIEKWKELENKLKSKFSIFKDLEIIYKNFYDNLVIKTINLKDCESKSMYSNLVALYMTKMHKYLFSNYSKCCSKIHKEGLNERCICCDCDCFICYSCIKYHSNHQLYDLSESLKFNYFNNTKGFNFKLFPVKNLSKEEDKKEFLNFLSENDLYFISKQYDKFIGSIDLTNQNSISCTSFLEVLVIEAVINELKKKISSYDVLFNNDKTESINDRERIKNKLIEFLEKQFFMLNISSINQGENFIRRSNLYDYYISYLDNNNQINNSFYKKENRELISQLIDRQKSSEIVTVGNQANSNIKYTNKVYSQISNITSLQYSPKNSFINKKIFLNNDKVYKGSYLNSIIKNPNLLSNHNNKSNLEMNLSVNSKLTNFNKKYYNMLREITGLIKKSIIDNSCILKLKEVNNNYKTISKYYKIMFVNSVIQRMDLSMNLKMKLNLINNTISGAFKEKSESIGIMNKINKPLVSNVNLSTKNILKKNKIISSGKSLGNFEKSDMANISNIISYLLLKDMYDSVQWYLTKKYSEIKHMNSNKIITTKNDIRNEIDTPFIAPDKEFLYEFNSKTPNLHRVSVVDNIIDYEYFYNNKLNVTYENKGNNTIKTKSKSKLLMAVDYISSVLQKASNLGTPIYKNKS